MLRSARPETGPKSPVDQESSRPTQLPATVPVVNAGRSPPDNYIPHCGTTIVWDWVRFASKCFPFNKPPGTAPADERRGLGRAQHGRRYQSFSL